MQTHSLTPSCPPLAQLHAILLTESPCQHTRLPSADQSAILSWIWYKGESTVLTTLLLHLTLVALTQLWLLLPITPHSCYRWALHQHSQSGQKVGWQQLYHAQPCATGPAPPPAVSARVCVCDNHSNTAHLGLPEPHGKESRISGHVDTGNALKTQLSELTRVDLFKIF